MSAIPVAHIYQKYIARNTYALFEYLDTKFVRRMKLWQGLCIAASLMLGFVAALMVTVHLFPAYTMLLMFGFSFLLIAGMGTLMTMNTYDFNYGNPFTVKRADRLAELLRVRGPMEAIMLLREYQDKHHDYIDSDELTGVLSASDQRDRFLITNNVVHLPEQRLDDVVPPPANDDYVRGYHALYRRLQAIRANPELLYVQDGLIDDMYANR